ncbi:hypothetical protein BpHYR1_031591 [Brachionus plicatilis]|uniref:Uncharacterized protein n=1 Tax=Brachionus plicatilis TaxID=10195 RepID=A0A3M7T080_BRAPC|nr:hypothetical protein BpHYR1_031591 [Brachionus plicatilis]
MENENFADLLGSKVVAIIFSIFVLLIIFRLRHIFGANRPVTRSGQIFRQHELFKCQMMVGINDLNKLIWYSKLFSEF